MTLVLHADVIVVGASLGGTIAARAAARAGLNVILTEQTDWIGGQLTSQAVPPDEHRWIESFGCTASYREFRDRVREYYRRNYPLNDEAMNDPVLNPGNGWVSRIAHEPKIALRVLEDMMAAYINSGQIRILYHTVPNGADCKGDHVQSVSVRHVHTGEELVLTGEYFLDGTDNGDLLPIVGAEYVVGAESGEETGEPHALFKADACDIQSITHVAALEYVEGGNFMIERPASYDFWKAYTPLPDRMPLFSWFAGDANDTTKQKQFTMFPNDQGITPLWTYRRIVDPSIWREALPTGEVTLLNWAQNDYYLAPIIGVGSQKQREHEEQARDLTRSLVYWLQTEAPRLDGGAGYPGVRLRGDILGTTDGLAKTAYIRESRRIKARYTVTEHDVSKELRGDQGIKQYRDSVGVGSYHLDLHPTTKSLRSFYIPNYPYEIPLGSLIPIRMKNLLPACKNIGMTQIANGCYRLHPTEWNIGEAAGYLAAYCLRHGIQPAHVLDSSEHLEQYQLLLTHQGVELHWPDEVYDTMY
ncbi:FAD-dependent oxidoreductase [Paenibacillus sp. 453mf]|uniref:FAD-dependent oxidoreductase n=1 Tax=Paenibacillus sp. 453mf TaxID=1761874 RepID=UPI0008F154F9|nr:FAD-dependent oxidoreductase [Paenibacillus sp. 453mf]SFS78421.1 FAD dependent oxidoreductase [Paenibacillus sp. 453mf]